MGSQQKTLLDWNSQRIEAEEPAARGSRKQAAAATGPGLEIGDRVRLLPSGKRFTHGFENIPATVIEIGELARYNAAMRSIRLAFDNGERWYFARRDLEKIEDASPARQNGSGATE